MLSFTVRNSVVDTSIIGGLVPDHRKIGKISFLLRQIALHLTLLLTKLNAGSLALYSAPTGQDDFDIYRRAKHILLPAKQYGDVTKCIL
jgi:hypothetical protein